jgi:hypothetical protein
VQSGVGWMAYGRRMAKARMTRALRRRGIWRARTRDRGMQKRVISVRTSKAKMTSQRTAYDYKYERENLVHFRLTWPEHCAARSIQGCEGLQLTETRRTDAMVDTAIPPMVTQRRILWIRGGDRRWQSNATEYFESPRMRI